jgi:hypothetical protein
MQKVKGYMKSMKLTLIVRSTRGQFIASIKRSWRRSWGQSWWLLTVMACSHYILLDATYFSITGVMFLLKELLLRLLLYRMTLAFAFRSAYYGLQRYLCTLK